MSRKVINNVFKKSNIIYFDTRNADDLFFVYVYSGFLFKFRDKIGEELQIDLGFSASDYYHNGNNQNEYKIYAAAIDFDIKISPTKTVKDKLIQLGYYEELMSLPQITEEEFYDLTMPTE